MVRSYKSHTLINGIKFSCATVLKKNKFKILLSLILVLVAIFTGVFVAIKSHNNYNLGMLQEINLDDFYCGVVASSSAFMSRMLSLTVNFLILVGLSFSPYLFLLAQVLYIYRGYLFGLNFALIFIFYGIGSMVTAVVVILPCQLLTIFAFIMFHTILTGMNSNCKKYGNEKYRWLFIIFCYILLILINLIETILLFLLNGKVILVI